MASTRTSINPLVDEGIVLTGPVRSEYASVLAPDALRFVADLARHFTARRDELMKLRAIRQHEIDAGHFPDFLPETRSVREGTWKVAPIPHDLEDRRVEITGPVDRKMVITALNSGASTFMADFEDSNSPTWANCVTGQVNLYDAVRRAIEYYSPEGKHYALKEKVATLMVRPRGWHLDERHMRVDGTPVPGALFDFGLFFFHNARELVARGSGPYFYLPKMESHLEARLWNEVFLRAQERAGVAAGTIRATVLIETILGAFEMDEILYELRCHAAGLNCGRCDYIFSFIKRFRNHPQFVLPDRATVGMDQHFLKSYVDLLVSTCHRRGAHAMGGMATPDQPRCTCGNAHVSAADLLTVPRGTITEAGLRTNINVGVLYLESWLRGSGYVPLYNLMEDAATAEISRAQVWQWVRHGARMDDGRVVTREMVHATLREEMEHIRARTGEAAWATGRFGTACKLFSGMMTGEEFPEFMPSLAYEFLQ